MKHLTQNDIDFLRRMWVLRRCLRVDLPSSDQRAADRLADAGIMEREEIRENLAGRGYMHDRGSGILVIFSYNPQHALSVGNPAILAQIRARAPDVLEGRPTGAAAQARFRIVKPLDFID